MSRWTLSFLAGAAAAALLPACGQVTAVRDDADVTVDAAADAGGEGGAGGDAGVDRSTDSGSTGGTCPGDIALCVAALQALRASCRGAGACQTATEMGTRRVNQCYGDGVRVYMDPSLTTVLRADGRVCYTIEGGLAGALIDQRVLDPAGVEVLRLTRNIRLSYQTFGCGTASADVQDSERPCGDTSLLPDQAACVTGTCVRP